jgi:hypothetical protein
MGAALPTLAGAGPLALGAGPLAAGMTGAWYMRHPEQPAGPQIVDYVEAPEHVTHDHVEDGTIQVPHPIGPVYRIYKDTFHFGTLSEHLQHSTGDSNVWKRCDPDIGGTACEYINAIPQGLGYNKRKGHSVLLRRLSISFATWAYINTPVQKQFPLRVVVLRNRTPESHAGYHSVLTDAMSSTNVTTGMFDPSMEHQYQILHDRIYLPLINGQHEDNSNTAINVNHHGVIDIPLNIRSTYEHGTASHIPEANCRLNSITIWIGTWGLTSSANDGGLIFGGEFKLAWDDLGH